MDLQGMTPGQLETIEKSRRRCQKLFQQTAVLSVLSSDKSILRNGYPWLMTYSLLEGQEFHSVLQAHCFVLLRYEVCIGPDLKPAFLDLGPSSNMLCTFYHYFIASIWVPPAVGFV
jgi:hypothetical protein